MKRAILTKLTKVLKELKFDKDTMSLVIECAKIGDREDVDPFHFDLKHTILEPLEEKFPYPYDKMRKMISGCIYSNWDDCEEEYTKLGFKSKPTTKAFISFLILKIQKEEI